MPDNNINIEELVKLINKGYTRQTQRFEDLLKKRNSAVDGGATAEYINVSNCEIERLIESLNTKRETTESFYEEMVKLSGDRTEKDALEFRVKYL